MVQASTSGSNTPDELVPTTSTRPSLRRTGGATDPDGADVARHDPSAGSKKYTLDWEKKAWETIRTLPSGRAADSFP